MAVYVKIEEIDATQEKWIHYAERLEAKKRAILLSVIGPTTYSLLRFLSCHMTRLAKL